MRQNSISNIKNIILIYKKAYKNIISKEFAKDIIKLKEYQLCPYCKRSYISLISLSDGKCLRPDLDHFYPKSDYFYLSITIDNLIPSCLSCNQRLKKAKKPKICFTDTQNIFKKIKFEVDIVSKRIYIKNLDELDDDEKDWIKNMAIQESYGIHTEILDNIYDKYEKYRKSNIEDISKIINLYPYQIKNIVFAEYEIMSEKNEPLYKLKKDLFQQIVK